MSRFKFNDVLMEDCAKMENDEVIEIVEYGYEGDFEQLFFVSPLPAEEVVEKLKEETNFTYAPEYVGDNAISYMSGFKLIEAKLLDWGFKPIWVNTGLMEHLGTYILIDEDIYPNGNGTERAIVIELRKYATEIKDKFYIPEKNIELVTKEHDTE